MQEFVEHFATTEELLEKAFSNDRRTVHEDTRDDNRQTSKQKPIRKNKRMETIPKENFTV